MTTIKLKNGSGAPTAGDLAQGEPALDLTNKRLYTEDSGGTVIEVGTNPGVDVTFADNRKAIFGAGSDLQIYHDGNHSYVSDQGTGSLRIQATDLGLETAAGNQNYLTGVTGGAVTLFHNGSTKLATTSTGVDVTGTIVSDGVEVDGLLHIDGSDNSNVASFALTRTDASWSIDNETNFRIYGNTGDTTNPATKRFEIGTNGDISFYEDTGTTAKFYWDASAESLGLGATGVFNGTQSLNLDGDGLALKNNRNGSNNNWSIIRNTATASESNISFVSGAGEAMVIDHGGNVGIGTNSPVTLKSATTLQVDGNAKLGDDNGRGLLSLGDIASTGANAGIWRGAAGAYAGTGNYLNLGGYDGITFTTGNADISSQTEAMRIDSSGNLLVGTTTVNGTGITLGAGDYGYFSRSGDAALFVNRSTSDGSLIELRKADVAVGSIGYASSALFMGGGDVGLRFDEANDRITPVGNASNLEAVRDDAIDLGYGTGRFQDIYATNGTIQTSDRNEKQDIEALSDAEQRVAVACKGLLRKFRWKSSVAENGDDARIHFGIIAQDLQDAFTAEGLDAGRYAMFINSTWTDEETGEERSRMGVRYSELLAFIIAAI